MAQQKPKQQNKEQRLATGVSFHSYPQPGRGLGGKIWHGIGNTLYVLGYSCEYWLTQTGRVLRDAALFFAQILGMLGGWLWRGLKGLCKGLWLDIKAPFARFLRRHRQLKRLRQRAQANSAGQDAATVFAGIQMKSTAQLAAGVAGILMPVAAFVIFLFTVHSLTGMEYALAVEMNGQVLGYVVDQNVVEGAKNLLRDRIRLAGNQEIGDWQISPVFTIARAPAYTTTHQLANEILLYGSGEADLVEATGVYLNGELYAVTTEGERVKQYLDETLSKWSAQAPEGASVSFVTTVECEPNSDDVFFSSSVEDLDTLLQRLQGNASEAVKVEASGEITLGELALANGLTMEELLSRNPLLLQTAEEVTVDSEYVPEEGTELLIYREQPVLQVQTLVEESYMEVIPYAVVEQENPEKPQGMKTTLQQGADGLQQVCDQIIFIDGEQTARNRLDERTEILQPPVPEIIEVGTQEVFFASGLGGGAGIQGSYMFPVPGYSGSSRGFSAGHRGLDINAPAGVPIFACEGGTVVAAGWHYSWGYYVEIAHPGGVNTLYAHCSALFVTAGQTVGHGQHIAAIGSTGNSSGNHCHLEITVGGQLVDPLAFVSFP